MPRPYPATSFSGGLTEVKYKLREGKEVGERKTERERLRLGEDEGMSPPRREKERSAKYERCSFHCW